MESNLFVDLSDEQQELVAGGVDFAADATIFAQRIAAVGSSSESGPGGSKTSSLGLSSRTFTAGAELTALDAPGAVGLIQPAIVL